jgi:N-acetylmuramoyl-L-alanine amidase
MAKGIRVFFIVLLFLGSTGQVFAADFSVSYVNSSRTDHIPVYYLEGGEYVNVYDLERVFDANSTIDPGSQSITLNLLNSRCVFFFENRWVKFGGQHYNLYNEILIRDGTFYIPDYFLFLCSEKFFPDKITLDGKHIVANLGSVQEFLIKRIVLDPGHGGKDPGAVGRYLGVQEKDVVLEIAKKTKKLLEDNLDVEVLLTREDDRFVSLAERTEFANKHKADLFVSIHCNAAYNSATNGSEVYYLSPAKTDEARAVEALENDVIRFESPEARKRYTDLDFILYDMRQMEHLRESIDLAGRSQRSLVNELGTKDRGIKFANFYVLRGAFMPAILVEVAFLSNQWEERKLRTPEFQKKAAMAIYTSIKQFKEKYDMMN